MKVMSSNYNVLTVDFGSVPSSGTQVIGTADDFAMLKKICLKSGVIKFQGIVDNQQLISTAVIRPSASGNAMYAVGRASLGIAEKVFEGTFLLNSDGLGFRARVSDPS